MIDELIQIGFGTGSAASDNKKATGWFSNVDKDLVANISTAIKLGYYHLDGAEMYETYVDLGAAIKASSKVPREKLFITGKCDPSTSIDNISGSFDKMLKELNVEYVDLYLMHEPFWAKGDEKRLQEKWTEFEELQNSGKTKAIGVSNCIQPQVEAILKTAKILPIVNQIEYHPYLQHEGLVDWLKSKNIQVCGYAPLTPTTRAAGKSPELDALLDALAKKYYVHAGQILLRWSIEQDVVPITTTSKEITMSDILRAITFKLTPKEWNQITELGKGVHYRGFWTKHYDENDKR